MLSIDVVVVFLLVFEAIQASTNHEICSFLLQSLAGNYINPGLIKDKIS